MRVIDAHESRFPPSPKKRGRKKHKEQTVDRFLQCRMKTADDWYPNLTGPEGKEDEVQVTVLGWRKHYDPEDESPAFRVCVWGGDDFGLERDFSYSETTPLELVQFVLWMPQPVTQQWLRDQGFWNA